MASTGSTNRFEYAPAPESRSVVDIKSSYGLFVNGEFVDPTGGRSFKTINPATEEVLAEVSEASADDVDLAVKAARRAYTRVWSRLSGRERSKYLFRIARILQERSREFAVLESIDNGKPIKESRDVDVPTAAAHFFYYAGWADKLGHAGFGDDPQPLGVAGQVIPWNFPLLMLAWKIAPALAAGNTVVLKPAPDTPWSATFIGRVAAEQTDIPPGVLNVVTSGDAATVGEMLTTDPRVDLVSFTGSTATGRRIMASGAETLKKVFLELGGKSANVILDDADFAAAVPSGSMICMHGGQGCAITTRMLLPKSHYDEAVDILKTAFENVPYGDPTDPGNIMGPLVNARQRDRVLGYIEKGKAEGARLLVGGGRPQHLDKGYYVEPTLFVDVDPDATIAQEEIFGPVLCVLKYDGDDDAVRIANNSMYGLSGSVTSASLERAEAVARRIRTGTVSVNGGMWFGPDSPFGGYRQSGIGREHGIEGFEEYLETKTLGLPATA
jgi:aldehyde dehydrogenase (NAD+)